MPSAGSCEVILNSHLCQDPPSGGSGYTRTHCFACGNTVCKGCSRLRPWHKHRRVRVCEDCEEEERKDQPHEE